MAGGLIRVGARKDGSRLAPGARLPLLVPVGRNDGHGERVEKEAGFKWVREALTRTQEALRTLQEAEELHRLLFEKVPHPRFVYDARTLRILVVNDAAVRRYGYSREEFLHMQVTDLSEPGCAATFTKYCRLSAKSDASAFDRRSVMFRHRRKDGRTIDIDVNTTLIPLRRRRMVLLLAQDVTEKRRAEQRLRAQQATTHALAEFSTLAEAGPEIFRAICENLGADWGELWRVDPTGHVLWCTQIWRPETPAVRVPHRAVRAAVFARGQGIPGRVWARNKPLWVADVARHPELRQAAPIERYGLRSVFAFPIRLNKEVLGVITIFSRQVLPPDKHLLRMLTDICSQIGQVMGRRRAERQLLEVCEREQQRIGQDLHDGLCQQLAGLAYIASDLENKLAKKFIPDAIIAGRIAALARTTAVQARQVARGLNPVKLGTMGLMAALDGLTASIQSMFSISCRFECRSPVLVPDHELAVHLYRITQEAIHNSVTHGKATDILVSLQRGREGLVLSVADNGSGFSCPAAGSWGMGLENMHYRARAMGGKLEFRPRAQGGTTVMCTVPGIHGRSR